MHGFMNVKYLIWFRKICVLTAGDGVGGNTRYTEEYIFNAGRTIDTCHIRDFILIPASPLSAAAARW
jgi:hypothetical protein